MDESIDYTHSENVIMIVTNTFKETSILYTEKNIRRIQRMMAHNDAFLCADSHNFDSL